MSVLDDLRECARSWEPEARLLGNVRACEIVELCDELAETRAHLDLANANLRSALLDASCTPAERAVLDAMGGIELEVLEAIRDKRSAAHPIWHPPALAELARRGEKP